MASGEPTEWNRHEDDEESSSDDDGDRLRPSNCYDADTDYVYSRWSANLPDYGRSMAESSDANSQNYVGELRHNNRIARIRNIYQPSFVNGIQDNSKRSNQFLPIPASNPRPKFTSCGGTSGSSSNSDAQSQEKMYKARAEISTSLKSTPSGSSQLKNVRRNLLEQMSGLDVVHETSPTIKKEKLTTVSRLIGSIEGAIKNGNESFVRGPLHPLQRNTHLLKLNRRSGFTNEFTMEDYLQITPPTPFPREPDYSSVYRSLNDEERLAFLQQQEQCNKK